MDRLQDADPLETREWVDALEAVLEIEGPERAHFLLEQLVDKARRSGAYLPYSAQTAYLNTIPPHLEERLPGDRGIENRIRSLVRWNAVAMVLRAGRKDLELGGCTSRVIRLRECTRARSSRGASPRRSSTCSARRSTARASHPIRTPG